ncbi:ABC transporter transmembrane domain-containing protein [Legionella parisiensis]|uniref:Toxin RTX-I translocation ATP-binding protein n=1 Tax=Legionella parisiensis TaxID=45071 RepID=A0A1E5JWR1_9GAMM|nr:ABC transporter transmembrane domain-containing protein [Legionella parisiensis]KTD44377.1 toxin secretion ABC transporter ATP-binding protein [Legionella parisiensis]OEH48966.1 Toxin RTX-I translocation ATP-binding protein [Legionella parisiensis]STX72003.1 toxin secretion ABC transporter ATP-binding protein [Legionella parisiensis]
MMRQEMNSIAEVLDKATIASIAMISVIVSLLSLSIPIAAQTLVNLIAFGKLLQPVVTLSIMVLILMIALGALNVWQSIIIEVIQQKLMVRISLNLTRQFTHLSLDNFSSHHGPELVNRFFEVVTINKALSSLLLYGVNLSLQLFFGLILLLFYHPLFLVFDGFIVFGIILIVFLPYRKGLSSSEKECTEKHQIGAWLEELLANRFLFRFNRYHHYATQQTDKRLVSFLKARNMHFKQLIKHQIGFYLLSAIASSLLLGLGGYLVINNQLSLGQLVAAEIVLGALIYAFKRFSVLLENYYDLVASEHKIDQVLNLPTELINTELSELVIPIKNITLVTQDQEKAFCTPGNPLVICVNETQKKTSFTDFILGFENNTNLTAYINETLCHEEYRRSLREHTLLLRDKEWFAGSIYDNIRLNQPSFSIQRLKELLKSFRLMDKIMRQPHGLKSIIYDWEQVFTELELIQLMVIRALIAKPQLIIIDGLFDRMTTKDIELLLSHLAALNETLLIIITQYPNLIPLPNCLVLS